MELVALLRDCGIARRLAGRRASFRYDLVRKYENRRTTVSRLVSAGYRVQAARPGRGLKDGTAARRSRAPDARRHGRATSDAVAVARAGAARFRRDSRSAADRDLHLRRRRA